LHILEASHSQSIVYFKFSFFHSIYLVENSFWFIEYLIPCFYFGVSIPFPKSSNFKLLNQSFF